MRLPIALVAALSAGSACRTAAAPPPAPVGNAVASPTAPPPPAAATVRGDVDHELAWARGRWPRELGAVGVGTARARFVAWLGAAATLPVWVTTPQFTCARGELHRKPDAGDDNEALELTVYTRESLTTREYQTASVAGELELGGSGGSETRNPDGTWQSAGGWMMSDQGSMGHLSKVTDEVAEFAGVWVDITAACGGASSTLACAGGGTIACSACTDVAITVRDREMGMIRHVYAAALPDPGCPRCPERSNAELERVSELIGAIDPWVTRRQNASAIYRSVTRCRAGG